LSLEEGFNIFAGSQERVDVTHANQAVTAPLKTHPLSVAVDIMVSWDTEDPWFGYAGCGAKSVEELSHQSILIFLS
jgi:hypothetical protein